MAIRVIGAVISILWIPVCFALLGKVAVKDQIYYIKQNWKNKI